MDFLEDVLESFRRKHRHGHSHYGDPDRHGQHHDDHYDQVDYEELHVYQLNNTLLSCPKCSENMLPSYGFCPNCGSPAQKSLLCSFCKKKIPPSQNSAPLAELDQVSFFMPSEAGWLDVSIASSWKGFICKRRHTG